MKPFLFIAVFCFFGIASQAQHNHFVYVQSDNKQPFYVRLKDKLYSSSASGYVIIPKLSAGDQDLSFGFPGNEVPSQNISIKIAGKDMGFLLKNFPGKGWGLFNIQSMDVVMASGAAKKANTAQSETRTDAFSNTLADVVNTPSIKEVDKTEPKKEEKSEPVVPVAPVVKVEDVRTETPNPAPVVPAKEATGVMSVVKKINSSQSASSIAMQYFVSDEFGNDTVNVEITTITAINEPVVTAEPKPTPSEMVAKPVETAKTDEPKFIDIDLPNPNKESKVAEPANSSKEEGPKPISVSKDKGSELKMINSDCKAIARDDDFLKTRKKMTSQKSDDAMVESARKLFKQKCYSTEQVKNLSVLFLKDEAKYKFYDAIYPFVYDSKSFKELESTLTDEYYISRFRTMIRN